MGISCQVRLVKNLVAPALTRRDVTRETILAAGVRCFSRDGYRRTALDRVAREAGISRAALYLHFANKEDLFRALVGDLHARTVEEATAAARGTGTLADRVSALLIAKSGPFFDLLRTSTHAAEFIDENHRLCGDLSTDASAKHARLLGKLLATADAAGEISLAASGITAARAAEILLDATEGIKDRGRTTLSPSAFRQRLAEAARLLIAGLARPAGSACRRRPAR